MSEDFEEVYEKLDEMDEKLDKIIDNTTFDTVDVSKYKPTGMNW